MKKIDFAQRHKGSSIAIAVLAGAALFVSGISGCSDTGLHLPAYLWQSKNKNPKDDAELSKEALATAAPYAPPTTPSTSSDTVDSVVASVDGNPITSQDVRTMGATKPGEANAREQLDPAANVPDDPNSKLKALITQQLVEQESQKYTDKVDDSDVDRMIQEIEDRNHMTDEQLRSQLQSQGISYATFRAKIRKQALEMAMFQHEVRDKALVPDAAIVAFYKDHIDEFTVSEEKYRLAQILIAVPAGAAPDQVAGAKQKAEEVYKRALKGDYFSDLARQYSDDDSKAKGGELGVFNPNDLNDAIAAGIKNVKAGEVSKVIRTKYGFHVIKVEEHQIPGTVPLADVKSMIREKLQGEKSKEGFQKWVDQDLVKEHYVETTE